MLGLLSSKQKSQVNAKGVYDKPDAMFQRQYKESQFLLWGYRWINSATHKWEQITLRTRNFSDILKWHSLEWLKICPDYQNESLRKIRTLQPSMNFNPLNQTGLTFNT